MKIQSANDVRDKILTHNPHGGREMVEAYLHHFGSSDLKRIESLALVLDERGLFGLFNGSVQELQKQVKAVEKEIELENFEKRLAEGKEQLLIDQIDTLSGYEFEEFLGELFIRMGYAIEQTKLSGDQGADIVVVKFGEITVIQAKRFGGKVGNKAIQEIMAAISHYRAKNGMVVTNNYFTPSAKDLARSNNIELIDRDVLEELIRNHW